ncbi:WD40/YVTN/BNR-like repeat-containing protein [Rubellimicrobium roseum]|uniref:Exo-alpha-sialidase n=1 Tax=Rubellimicrobium roseum TaxID=687525 RepID=A0A5C4NJA9_9RHOB|nr:exo-alpha-sialidase [Rubellimicrobium roseum]TNC74881.1 exo-alpha-sialidase [Rubellimicrobium roseum]
MANGRLHPVGVLVAGALLVSGGPGTAQEAAPVAELLGRTHVHGLALDPLDGGRLLLATHHGLYALDLATGAVAPLGESRQDFMGFSVAGDDRFLASGHPEAGGNSGVLLSTDGGASWARIAEGVDGPVDFHQMASSAADPGTVYGAYAGGLQRSRDGGATWTLVAPAPEGLIDLAASTADPERLFAATEAGLLVSGDGGATWEPAGPWTAPVSVVETGPGPEVQAFVLGKGLVRAGETGEGLGQWTTVSPPPGGDYLLHLATDGRRTYAVTGSGVLLVSEDGGASWAPFGG